MDRLYDLRTFLELASERYGQMKQVRKAEMLEQPPITDRIHSPKQKENVLVESKERQTEKNRSA